MTGPAPRLLIADDQADILEALRLFFKGERYETDSATSPAGVLRAIDSHDYDAVLIDLNYSRDTTSGKEGLELIEQIRDWDSTLPVVVMTAWASVELVVEAMRRGARDFVQKPWDNARLLTVITNQIELGRALRRGRRLESENKLLRDDGEVPIVAGSPAMRPVLEMAQRLGPSDANVLVRGENGTGKGVLARALHRASSRASRPMVSVNIGGLSEGVFESELFGHVKGAFTDARSDRIGRFELADGGTLFLDEIANLSLNQQAKLLRVLETGEFERVGSSQTRRTDVRLISATNASLEDEISRGAFRRDLLFRLNTVEIQLPPLRDRNADIPALAGLFLRQHTLRYRKNVDGFEDGAMRALLAHSWPGNVRELDHVIERAVLMSDGRMIRRGDLGIEDGGRTAAAGLDELSLEEVESILIRKALARFDGNVTRAAEALGLSRSALYRRIQRHDL
ncbi:MAG: sigma-54 dependent transcriptional regulator [Acidobacteriota bacterium]